MLLTHIEEKLLLALFKSNIDKQSENQIVMAFNKSILVTVDLL